MRTHVCHKPAGDAVSWVFARHSSGDRRVAPYVGTRRAALDLKPLARTRRDGRRGLAGRWLRHHRPPAETASGGAARLSPGARTRRRISRAKLCAAVRKTACLRVTLSVATVLAWAAAPSFAPPAAPG